MKTTQEEAANMIVHQMADVKANEMLEVVDNIDIFVRRLHFCCNRGIPTSTCIDGFASS